MTALAEILEVQRLDVRAGDVVTVRIGAAHEAVTPAMAQEIRDRIRDLLGLPDLKVLVLPRDVTVEASRDEGT